jgi:hypothetical protein
MGACILNELYFGTYGREPFAPRHVPWAPASVQGETPQSPENDDNREVGDRPGNEGNKRNIASTKNYKLQNDAQNLH